MRSILHRHILLTFLPFGAIGAAFLPPPAFAQTFSKIIVFGDSLSDNGNASRFGVVAPAVFNNGRFSNGPVWVEQLGFGSIGGYGVVTGSADYAVAGTLTGQQATHPGLQTQITSYLQGGGKFTSSTLTTVWAGVNDIIAGVNQAAGGPNPQTVVSQVATTAANNVGTVLDAIASSGGGTVLVLNQPKLSLTPANGGATDGTLADLGTTTFNATLTEQIKAEKAAHPQTTFVSLDVASLYSAVVKNPAAFGFANATNDCYGAGSPCANPGDYFFGDGVHPTTAGHHLIAEFAEETLKDISSYGTVGVPMAAEAETTLRRRSQAMDSALAHIQGAAFDRGSPTLSFAGSGNLARQDARNAGTMPAAVEQAVSLLGFLDFYPSQSLSGGGQLGLVASDNQAGALKYLDESVSADLYISLRSPHGWFLNALAGGGYDNFAKIKRLSSAQGLENTASTTGWSGSGKIQAGRYFPLGHSTLSPRAAIAYERDQVQPYSESGLLPQMSFSARRIVVPSADVGLRYETPAERAWLGYFELGYRQYLSFDASPVTVSLANNTAPSISTVIGHPSASHLTISTGIRRQISAHFSLNLQYRGEFGMDYESHVATMGIHFQW